MSWDLLNIPYFEVVTKAYKVSSLRKEEFWPEDEVAVI